jgi:hypothetical protein
MSWEALTAISSILSVVVVIVAALAAVRQLRHMSLANQLHAYLEITRFSSSDEWIEGRRFLRSLDLGDPAQLSAVTSPDIDRRILALAVHYQHVARLLNLGLLDDALFGAYYDMAPRIWSELQPIAAVMRERTGTPIWVDIEYLSYRERKQRILHKILRRYPADFVQYANLVDLFEAAGRRALDAPRRASVAVEGLHEA